MRPSIVQLRNPIQHYAWGSHEAIARLQGRDSPTPEPEAELWIGDHPSAPSAVMQPGGPVPLPEWIARDPVPVLGAGREHLPFLAKVLAAARSLSLQVHPNAVQARAGFARERAAGIPDARRCYRDPEAKHELLVALAPFEALCGLRDDAQVRELVAGLPRLAGLDLAEATSGPVALRLLAGLQALDAEGRRGVLAEIERFAAGGGRESRAVRRLLDEHPDDPLAAAPLLLNPVELAPGDGLVVRPGTLHSYLCGTAVEVMTRSDNVVRAGLTRKHVDPAELLAVVRPVTGPAERVEPAVVGDGELRYDAGVDAFGLWVRTLSAGQDRLICTAGSPVLVLCVGGRVELREGASGTVPVALGAGQAALVPARIESFQLRGTVGTSRVFQVAAR